MFGTDEEEEIPALPPEELSLEDLDDDEDDNGEELEDLEDVAEPTRGGSHQNRGVIGKSEPIVTRGRRKAAFRDTSHPMRYWLQFVTEEW
jgi:hypothetical protein